LNSRCTEATFNNLLGHDTFERIEGRWRFDTRIMLVDLGGDLSHHLLFELR
jgi:hypothetical protein